MLNLFKSFKSIYRPIVVFIIRSTASNKNHDKLTPTFSKETIEKLLKMS